MSGFTKVYYSKQLKNESKVLIRITMDWFCHYLWHVCIVFISTTVKITNTNMSTKLCLKVILHSQMHINTNYNKPTKWFLGNCNIINHGHIYFSWIVTRDTKVQRTKCFFFNHMLSSRAFWQMIQSSAVQRGWPCDMNDQGSTRTYNL